MTREDYCALIEVSDAITQLDVGFEALFGVGHSGGNLGGFDKIYDVLLHYADEYYHADRAEVWILFNQILADTNKSIDERADILIQGMITCEMEEGQKYLAQEQ